MRWTLMLIGLVGCGPSFDGFSLLAGSGDATAPSLVVGPVLQNAKPEAMGIMWETDFDDETVVEWGDSPALGNTVRGDVVRRPDGHRIHHATITGLEAGKRYYYSARSGTLRTPATAFKTPPPRGSRASFRFAVYSDCQQQPEVHGRLVDRAIAPVADDLGFVLVAGDLVQDGHNYPEYKERFFDPIAPVAKSVPYFATIGNHEKNDPAYFDYLDLPRNGTPGYEEHWYSFDWGNAHVIGLDTNGDYSIGRQTDWLDHDLAGVCNDPDIDFVFAYFHHPYKSELWVPGENWFSGIVVRKMEAHMAECGKQGAYFFGHTHGYSRGQSKDVPFYWVNVGTAGGYIDRWDEHQQRDYPEFQKSFDEYGVLMVEVNPAGVEGFEAQRISFGDDEFPKDGEIQDEFFLSKRNAPPTTPQLKSARIAGTNVELTASAFDDPDQHAWLESEWQVAADADHLNEPIAADWIRFENFYRDADTNAGVDPDVVDLTLPGAPQASWLARVRYRDRGLAWSAWSSPMPLRSPTTH